MQKEYEIDQSVLQAFHEWEASYDWDSFVKRAELDPDYGIFAEGSVHAEVAPIQAEPSPERATSSSEHIIQSPEPSAPSPEHIEPAAECAEPISEVEQAVRPKRRRFRFYKILLLVVLVFVAAIGVGAVVFWRYIESYEISRHEHTIQSLRENIDYDFWERSLESALIRLLTEFETDASEPMERHLPKIRDQQYTFRQKTDESTPQNPVYIIRAGPRDIGVVRLSPAGDAGFGFNLWEVGSIEFLDSFAESLAGDVRISASQNARVELNGVPVSEEFRTAGEFEHGAAYLIRGIFGEAEVSVIEFDDSISSPYFAENGEFFFPIVNPFSRSFNIIAPDDANVFIDGEIVAAEHIATDGIIPEIFEGAVDPADAPLKLVRYEITLDGLYHEPAVMAEDGSGDELLYNTEEDDVIVFSAPASSELKTQHEATVESFIRAYVGFGANTGNNVSANFANVSSRVLRGSEIHTRTQAAISTMQWTSGVTLQYNSLEIDNFRSHGDEFFTCEIRYNITHRTRAEVSEVEGNFEVLFVLSDGRWLAAKMIVI